MRLVSRDVVELRCEGATRLWLRFADDTQGVVDVAAMVPFVGVFAGLSAPSYFALAALDPETRMVSWPSGAALDSDVLYAKLRGVAAWPESR